MDYNGLLIHHSGPKLVEKNDWLLLKVEFKLLLMICKIDLGYTRPHW